MLKQAVALLMASLLTVPAWPGVNPLGLVDSSKNATLSGVQALAGSTVFDSDGVKVLSSGSMSVVLTGGSRAMFAPDTEARFALNAAQIVVNLQRGVALLTTVAKSPVEGVVDNVSFRPATTDRPSVGWLELKEGHIVLYAARGNWSVNTEDGQTILLHEGYRLESAVAAPSQRTSVQSPKRNKKKLAAFFITAGLAGLAAGLAAGLEPTAFVDCVDPATPVVCGPSVASPVVP